MFKRLMISVNLLLMILFLGFSSPMMVHAIGNDEPRILVTGYDIEEGGINSGQVNELTITLKNMNQVFAVYSVLITYSLSSDDIYLEYGTSNQVYVESIQPNTEKKIVLSLDTADDLGKENISCKLNIAFTDDVRGSTSTEMVIYLPVNHERLSIYRTDFPNTAFVDTNSLVSVIFENEGVADIFNTIMEVKGSAMEDISVDLGTVQSGNRKNQEVYVSFDSAGEQYISVEFTYEDQSGNNYKTKSQSYKVDVISQRVEEEEVEAIVIEKNTLNNSFSYIEAGYIIGLILSVLGIVVIIIKRKRR